MAAAEQHKPSGWDSWDDASRRATYAQHDQHHLRARRIANADDFVSAINQYRASAHPTSNTSEVSSAAARVFVRARPLFPVESDSGEWECVSADQAYGELVVHVGSERVAAGRGSVRTLSHQTYPGVTSVITDDEVFSAVRYLVEAATNGCKSTLFAYGMTGSGKTYSMAGIHRRAPRELVRALTHGESLCLTAYELVGKRCFDLLSTDLTKPQVFLRVGDDGSTHVCGAVEMKIASADELERGLVLAASNRETAATGTNLTSSRSHAVYHIRFTSNSGSLMLIDLAGNEANAETMNHDHELMAEAAEINASLMAVNTCLRARATGATHVPYRDSTLTRVLRDALTDKESHVAMLACVSPACSHLERTVCTLRNAVKLLGDQPLPAPLLQDLDAPHKQSGEGSAKPAAPAARTSKSRKAEAMRSLAMSQLFGDLKASWGGDDCTVWVSDGWSMLLAETNRPELAALVDEARVLVLFQQAKQQLDSDEFNFAAFEAFFVWMAEDAGVKISALVKLCRASMGLPLCGNCLKEHTGDTGQEHIMSLRYTYNGKCPGCFKPWVPSDEEVAQMIGSSA